MRHIAPKFNRLPSVTIISSCDYDGQANMGEDMRLIVHEELSRLQDTTCWGSGLYTGDMHYEYHEASLSPVSPRREEPEFPAYRDSTLLNPRVPERAASRTGQFLQKTGTLISACQSLQQL